MARTGETSIKILNAGVVLPGSFNTIDLNGSLSGSDEGGGILNLTGSGGGTGTNIATELVTPVQSGSNITLDLTTLSHTFVAIEVVFRTGQATTPLADWSRTGNTITVLNADASEKFMVQYTY